jgi:hypothetical protein
MKKILLAASLGAALLGCNSASTDVTTANNTLAALAKNNIPAACAIIKVAEGYYAAVVPSPATAVETAEAAVAAICANPPTDLPAAFATLLQEWTIVQAATVAPAK